MTSRSRAWAVALVATSAALGATTVASPATARSAPSQPTVNVVTKGLDGPFGLTATAHHGFVVAESDSGQVTRVSPSGAQSVIFRHARGVAAATAYRRRVYAVMGGPNETTESATNRQRALKRSAVPASVATYPPSSVLRTTNHGLQVDVIANLLAYELKHNPDGQKQYVGGQQVHDSLSNPFAMNQSRLGLLVADGGANDVLKVNPRTGHVSTFFVPPTVKTPACLEDGVQSNPGTVGCDPVPTGVDVVGDSVYVSTLGSEVPGAGRVYKLDARTRAVQRVWKHLDAPTGVAASRSGAVFISQVLEGAPEGPPALDFDPSTIGQITKISHGKRSLAQVTMPTGLDFRHGHLYASTWSVAGLFLGIPHAGQIALVRQSAFSTPPV